MSKQVQFRRGTTSEHAAFTGAVGEITVNTTTHQLVSHDGVTAGGFPQAVAVGTTTDNAAIRANGTAGAMQNSALLIADTTGDLSRSGGGGIDIQGTSTDDSPPAGYIGEYVEAEVILGSAITLTNNTAADITSISLTAGDWDVWGSVGYANAAGTIVTFQGSWTSATSATSPTVPNKGAYALWRGSETGANGNKVFAVGVRRITLASTTTVYVSSLSLFSGGTSLTYGFIGARRVR